MNVTTVYVYIKRIHNQVVFVLARRTKSDEESLLQLRNYSTVGVTGA